MFRTASSAHSRRKVSSAENVCVLGAEMSQRLFPLESPLGRTVRVGEQYYRVIGIMERPARAASAMDGNSSQVAMDRMFIPLETARRRYGEVLIKRRSGSFEQERVALHEVTVKVDDAAQVLAVSLAIKDLMGRHHKKQDYETIVPLELLKRAERTKQVFNIVLGSIAAISLVVGGIGIMNIMLATVTERTREIGIRRALGAKQRDIIEQFLTETVVLSATGGFLGMGLGLLTPSTFRVIRWFTLNFILDSRPGALSDTSRMFSEMEPSVAIWSLPVAFGISVGIGIIFGLYPARAAAKLDPIEALRHE
mgnify:CR=1 FL=1